MPQSERNRCGRLPWMAAETAPGSLRHFLHPWRSEVLELPGAAPVKTWKVFISLRWNETINLPDITQPTYPT
ncbi:hypothetical protein EKO24_013075 [Candidatus Methylobacter oryzae]|uniref:Uncharacterized protein n=1 Tax=Candidatus Methylobacter oryzae TaxID=2497749 RepID=A0ABY3C939_9GAMM|nr:hypothetical protein EKO24_013075 [Candidatus Methylobacter oryzae]